MSNTDDREGFVPLPNGGTSIPWTPFAGDAPTVTLKSIEPACKWCSNQSTLVWHSGLCPKVKAMEYYPDGTIKRVEFNSGAV